MSLLPLEAVLLAGGKGENMMPLTRSLPKVLLRVVGRPLIDYVMDGLVKAGVKRVVVVLGDKGDMVKDHVEARWSDEVAVDFARQKGDTLEGAVLSGAEAVAGKPFLLAYGDIVTEATAYTHLVNTFVNSGLDGALLVAPSKDLETYGIVEKHNDRAIAVVEKPRLEVESSLAIAGVFILPPVYMEVLEEEGEMNTALNKVVSESEIAVSLWSRWWVDLGYPWDILTANRHVMSQLKGSSISGEAQIAPTSVVEGNVIIEEGAVVDHHAVLKGPTYVGRESLIGKGSFVREYTSVEEGVTVGTGADIKRCSLQLRSFIGNSCFIGDSVIGGDAFFEPNVVTLNVLPTGVRLTRLTPIRVRGRTLSKLGAIVGNEARIGANSVLYPGSFVECGEHIQPLSTVQPSEGYQYSWR